MSKKNPQITDLISQFLMVENQVNELEKAEDSNYQSSESQKLIAEMNDLEGQIWSLEVETIQELNMKFNWILSQYAMKGFMLVPEHAEVMKNDLNRLVA